MFYRFLSPAKLNLGLKIVGKRADGYHLLNSVFCLIDLFDWVDIKDTANDKISLLNHYQAWSYSKDLTYRAAILLQKLAHEKLNINRSLGASIKVSKIIPSGGGMGGGSSNAASVLIGLNLLWKLNLSVSQLSELALELGADVPFFIYGKNAYVSSIGEVLQPIEIPTQYFVLVKPNCHTNTKQVFENLSLNIKNKDKLSLQFETIPTCFDADYLIKHKQNDLENSVCDLFPEVAKVKEELSKLGTPRMTGSGSTLYLCYQDANTAKNVARYLGKYYNAYLVKSLNRSPIC